MLDGGCTCGTVRYRLTDRPLFTHCCHCTWCQRETGSAFVLNALIETACVTLLAGAPEVIDTPSASGKGQAIARCPSCRVALWSSYSGAGPRFCFVRVGTLDDAAALPPRHPHLYVDKAALGDPAAGRAGDARVLRPAPDVAACQSRPPAGGAGGLRCAAASPSPCRTRRWCSCSKRCRRTTCRRCRTGMSARPILSASLPRAKESCATGGRRLVAMRWGLVPPRYETPAGGPLLVNTRADTIAEKPALRAAVRERRRLIPASGVIQMDSDGRKGAAAPVRHAKRRAAADLAEIWQDWERDGQRLTTCAIVTCDAEGPMGRIHHRMPVQRGWS